MSTNDYHVVYSCGALDILTIQATFTEADPEIPAINPRKTLSGLSCDWVTDGLCAA